MAPTVSELLATLSSIDESTYQSAADRANIEDALLAAQRRIQQPWTVAFEQGWMQPAVVTAIKTLIDAGLWSKWNAAGNHTATIPELSKLTSLDAIFIGRLLRCITAEKLLLEVDEDTFGPTPFSKALGDDKFASVWNYMYHTNFPVFQHFPQFAAKTNYTNPVDAVHTNFESWAGPNQSVFTFYAANPEYGKDFANVMTLNAGSKIPWTAIYPAENITNGAKSDRALVVDMGGSVGHDLQKFASAVPNAPDGSLILQDLPHVIETAKLDAPIVASVHDFFEPQPVKGARAYYMHCVLHDWPEPEAVKILKNLANVMEKEYSRILVQEVVVKAMGGHRYEGAADLTMMFVMSASERSEATWRDLAQKAGLVVSKVWSSPESVESIIEMELP